jgi:hypothetical protein
MEKGLFSFMRWSDKQCPCWYTALETSSLIEAQAYWDKNHTEDVIFCYDGREACPMLIDRHCCENCSVKVAVLSSASCPLKLDFSEGLRVFTFNLTYLLACVGGHFI